MKRFTFKRIAALSFLLFPLAFISQPAHAMKCIAYMSIDGGKWVCAGWQETSPCEGVDQRCIPVPPSRPPVRPTDPGAPPPGASPGGSDKLSPEEMSCKQVNQQIAEQKKIIDGLNATIQLAGGEVAKAELALADNLSESAVNTAAADKVTACKAWADMQMADPDMMVCTEPANNRPARCRLRRLTSAEQGIKNSCDAKTTKASLLSKSRTNLLEVDRVNRAILASAERKKAIASVHLKKLRDAKDAKANCP